jgi:hypothetical protein
MLISIVFRKMVYHFFLTICNAKFLVSFLLSLGRARGKSKWRVVVGCNWPDFEGPLLCACWFKADGWINYCYMVICLGLYPLFLELIQTVICFCGSYLISSFFRVRINLKQFIGDIDNAAVPCGLGRAIGNKVLILYY